MKVAVFNRYWTTGGGAETYGAAIAQVLAADHDVTLLGPDPVDLDRLGERLRLDLAGVSFRRLEHRPDAVTRASGDYDLFINVAFLSADRGAAPTNLYITHFPAPPAPDLTRRHRLAIRALAPIVQRHAVDTAWGEGFYPREGRRPRYFWTNGDASVRVQRPVDDDVVLRMLFIRQRPTSMPTAEVKILVDDTVVHTLELASGGSVLERRRGIPVDVPIPAHDGLGDDEVEVRIVSDSFVPAGDDERRLGVALTALHIGNRRLDRLGGRLGSWFPFLHRRLDDVAFLDSYDTVVANSEFTRGWIERWWGRDATVLYPPVQSQRPPPSSPSESPPASKEPIILSVGRFFAAEAGHSKKQLEMVEAFGRLHRSGRADGWTYHLVGGCADADAQYLEQVQDAARGLPVVFHVDASGEELADLYARSSVFWHATGLGEDPETTPDRLEHFGISTVEAMSAGLVPVVLGAAGQLEIVTDGVDGIMFQDLDGLVAGTQDLMDDADKREAMAVAARRRAADFDLPAFAERLEAVISAAGPPPT